MTVDVKAVLDDDDESVVVVFVVVVDADTNGR
jgi:hypothetical protein